MDYPKITFKQITIGDELSMIIDKSNYNFDQIMMNSDIFRPKEGEKGERGIPGATGIGLKGDKGDVGSKIHYSSTPISANTQVLVVDYKIGDTVIDSTGTYFEIISDGIGGKLYKYNLNMTLLSSTSFLMNEFEYLDGPNITQFVQRNNPDSPSPGSPKSENIVLVKRINNTDSEFFRLLLGSDRYLSDPNDITLYLANIPSQKNKDVNDVDSPFYSQIGLKFRPNSTSSLTANTGYIKYHESGDDCIMSLINGNVGLFQYYNIADPSLNVLYYKGYRNRFIGNQNLNNITTSLDVVNGYNGNQNAILSNGYDLTIINSGFNFSLIANNVTLSTSNVYITGNYVYVNSNRSLAFADNTNMILGDTNLTTYIKSNYHLLRYDGITAFHVWDSGYQGHGTGMDSDTLDGQHGSYYRNVDNMNAGILPVSRGGLGSNVYTHDSIPIYKSFSGAFQALERGRSLGQFSLNGSYIGSNTVIVSDINGEFISETKNSAFNRPFGGNGVIDYVSRSDHDHGWLYEPIIGVLSVSKGGLGNNSWSNGSIPYYNSSTGRFETLYQNDAFNRSFGGSGSIYGNSNYIARFDHNHQGTYSLISHNHSGVYEPVFSKNSAFNKNFGGSGSADTVARSDHKVHDAIDLWVYTVDINSLSDTVNNVGTPPSDYYSRIFSNEYSRYSHNNLCGLAYWHKYASWTQVVYTQETFIACPFLYFKKDNELEFYSEIIKNQNNIDLDKEDVISNISKRYLENNKLTIVIKEEKEEITYLNYVKLFVNGNIIKEEKNIFSDKYFVLRNGESIEISYIIPYDINDINDIKITAKGYYQPMNFPKLLNNNI